MLSGKDTGDNSEPTRAYHAMSIMTADMATLPKGRLARNPHHTIARANTSKMRTYISLCWISVCSRTRQQSVAGSSGNSNHLTCSTTTFTLTHYQAYYPVTSSAVVHSCLDMKAPLLSFAEVDVGAATSSSKYATSNTAVLHPSTVTQRREVPVYALYLLIAVAVISSVLSVTLTVAWAVSLQHGAVSPFVVPAGSSSNSSDCVAVPSTPSAMENVTADQPNVLVPIVPKYPADTLMGQIKSHDLLHILSGLYAVAMNAGNGNRAITGVGFNASIDYLWSQIQSKTNLVNLEKSYFLRTASSTGVSNAFFTASILGKALSFAYPTDFRTYTNTAAVSNSTWATLYFVDAGGCDTGNWTDALGDSPSQPFYAIVYRTTTCTDANRIGFAQFYGATGVILASTIAGQGPAIGTAPVATGLAVISLSNDKSVQLISALDTYGSSGVSIALNLNVQYVHLVITNICGDTPAGDPTSVVLVGGHSDGVARGPGTNDDGSGSVSTLALAIAMTKLMQNTSLNYQPTNMVKFWYDAPTSNPHIPHTARTHCSQPCTYPYMSLADGMLLPLCCCCCSWFGAEEAGLLGSQEVVRVGLQRDNDASARVGSRARDWAIMIDLDMLGSLKSDNTQH